MGSRATFYTRTLLALKQKGWMTPGDSIVVLAGGAVDRDCMREAGLHNVVISNLEEESGNAGRPESHPYEWRNLDAERIAEPDNSFDWAVIHAGLHHLAIPALGVCEMFRVARKGILCIEARDSLLMRIAVRLGVTEAYEVSSVLLYQGAAGGCRHGPIPNFVYRWTEREFEKVISSYAPAYRHTFFYEYGYSLPQRLAGNLLLTGATWVASRMLANQGNQFAFGVMKNVQLQHWISEQKLLHDHETSAARGAA